MYLCQYSSSNFSDCKRYAGTELKRQSYMKAAKMIKSADSMKKEQNENKLITGKQWSRQPRLEIFQAEDHLSLLCWSPGVKTHRSGRAHPNLPRWGSMFPSSRGLWSGCCLGRSSGHSTFRRTGLPERSRVDCSCNSLDTVSTRNGQQEKRIILFFMHTTKSLKICIIIYNVIRRERNMIIFILPLSRRKNLHYQFNVAIFDLHLPHDHKI